LSLSVKSTHPQLAVEATQRSLIRAMRVQSLRISS
jgi:hypothetical protein